MAIKRMPAAHELVVEPGRVAEGVGERPRDLQADAGQFSRRSMHGRLNAEDGTRQLLVSGAGTMLVGLVAWLLTVFAFGGVGAQGAHSNAGWLALMVAMMATPFAVLLLLLGGAKWLRNLGLSRVPDQHRLPR